MRTPLIIAILALLALSVFAEEKPDTDWNAHMQRPNMVKNGDFEGDRETSEHGEYPEHWEAPRAPGVSIQKVGGDHKHVLQFDVERKVARTTGLMYYSKPIPVEQGQTYDITMHVKTRGGVTPIIFVKGYAQFDTGKFGKREREIYRHKKEVRGQKNEKGEWEFIPTNTWGRFQSYFTPRAPEGAKVRTHRGVETPTVEYVRIDLYAFGGGEGTVQFDNIRITRRPAEDSTTSQTLKQTDEVRK
ncbi:MAG: hypothetical protein ACOCVL_02790 [Candidatus Sumerlaeota bacterium]